MKVASNQDRLNELFDEDPRNDTAIAADLGVSKQAVSSWRNGSRSPKKTMLLHIAEVYHVSIDWLMGHDVDKYETSSSPIFIPDSQTFSILMNYILPEDRAILMEILERAFKKAKEKGAL